MVAVSSICCEQSQSGKMIWTNGNAKQNILDLAVFVSSLRNEGDQPEFANDISTKLESGDNAGALKTVIAASSNFQDVQEASDYKILYHLLLHAVTESEYCVELLPSLLANLSSPPTLFLDGARAMLFILINLFNALEEDKVQYRVLLHILDIADRFHLFDAIIEQLKPITA